LVQPGINIENGKTYKVSFEASAANTRTIEVEIASNLHNSSIFATTFEISKESKIYEFEFTMDKDSDKNGELRFNLGGSNVNVYIDNVVMKRVSTDEVEGNLILTAYLTAWQAGDMERMNLDRQILKVMRNNLGQLLALSVMKVGMYSCIRIMFRWNKGKPTKFLLMQNQRLTER